MQETFPRSFDDLFQTAFAVPPYRYQQRLAESDPVPSILNVPTGAGKTNAALATWLWKRFTQPTSIGRRLVYCLPMRSLVEQTFQVVESALEKLKESSDYAPLVENGNRFKVYKLLGGDVDDSWDLYPEAECILIGTQDLLLSRALNRGYAASRFRWPMHFGLLNNDCFWVFDEVQLMADGLATSTQLEAFREHFKTFGPARSLWMSATLETSWLNSIDFASKVPTLTLLELDDDDRQGEVLQRRLTASKSLQVAPAACRMPAGLAAFLLEHHEGGTKSLVVLNRVARAQEVFAELERLLAKRDAHQRPDLMLLHSRFRPAERLHWLDALMPPKRDAAKHPDIDRIIVATQVVEAGLDLDAALLVSDLAPYSSMVQRFGRCNRAGNRAGSQIFWVDAPLDSKSVKLMDVLPDEPGSDTLEALDDKMRQKVAAPYASGDLITSAKALAGMTSASPEDLPHVMQTYEPEHVIRRRDLVDLFDTSADLSGFDLDISRFVRGGDDRDVQVFWRNLGENKPDASLPAPLRDEFCSIPMWDLKPLLDKRKAKGWIWNIVSGEWEELEERSIRPGLTVLVDHSVGGYDVKRGWDLGVVKSVPVVQVKKDGPPEQGMDDDPGTKGQSYFQSLEAHSREVKQMAGTILLAMSDLTTGTSDASWRDQVLEAAHHHDWGKVHPIFQEVLSQPYSNEGVVLAKSCGGSRYKRPGFRHELASALALRGVGKAPLVVYLAGAHHGKVRLSIRAVPGEVPPSGKRDALFARGVYAGDRLASTSLGDGVLLPACELQLESMLLGRSEADEPSWLESTLSLRDSWGVFRLAWLETLVRAADARASQAPGEVIQWVKKGDRS